MIVAEHVTYGAILHDVSVEFGSGCWTHILGPNGAGKSTLLKVMASLLVPASGQVKVDDEDVRGLSVTARAQTVAYVPQRLEAVPELTVRDFVMQGAFACMDARLQAQRATAAMAHVGLTEFSERRLSTLSGGELQKAMIAGAIAQSAPVILLDEPTSALDLAQSERINGVLRSLAASGLTIVTVTHDIRQAARTADAVVLLNQGRVAWQGAGFPPSSVLSDVYGVAPTAFASLVEHSSSVEPVLAPPTRGETQTMPQAASRQFLVWGAVAVAALVLIAPFVGANFVNPFDLSSTDATILMSLRVPRVIWGAVSGATLAVVGASLQAMLQNPLATPYTLGLASGASLGAMIAISVGWTSLWILPVASFLGAGVTMSAVLAMTAHFGFKNPAFCLLAGVAASMFCSALSLVFQALATPLTAQQMMRWQMGGLDVVGYSTIALVPMIAFCCVGLFGQARALNLISVDTSLAQTRGVSVERTRRTTFVLASLATALVVAVCGPISFVGLLIPMWLRQRLGADLRCLVPLCALMGAMFILVSDMVARLVETTAYVPVGVVVAILGVPAVLGLVSGHART